MYVHVRVRVCGFVYVRRCTYVYGCMHINVHVLYVPIRICTVMFVYAHIYIYVYVCMSLYMYVTVDM